MSGILTPAALFPEELRKLKKVGTWLAILGVGLIILGLVALSSAVSVFSTTIATITVIGSILIAGGVIHIVNAVVGREWRGFVAHLLIGILYIVLGILMLNHPAEAAAGITLMLAVAFLAGGLLRVAVAAIERFPGWGWMLLSGLISFVLGLMIWRQYPSSALWVIGTFVGIDLVTCGITWLTLGLAARSART